jgi:hypothetical protein
MRERPVYIHVSKNTVKANVLEGRQDPPICMTLQGGEPSLHRTIVILNEPDGHEIARIVYRPDEPLGEKGSEGAHVWLQVKNQRLVQIEDEN